MPGRTTLATAPTSSLILHLSTIPRVLETRLAAAVMRSRRPRFRVTALVESYVTCWGGIPIPPSGPDRTGKSRLLPEARRAPLTGCRPLPQVRQEETSHERYRYDRDNPPPTKI